MLIDLKDFKVVKVTLKTPSSVENVEKMTLQFAYQFKSDCDKVEEISLLNGCLGMLIYSGDSLEKVEDSSLFLEVLIEAKFIVKNILSREAAEDEALRILFPHAQAFIAMLTTGAHTPTLFVPGLTSEDIKKRRESEKTMPKRKKRTKDPVK